MAQIELKFDNTLKQTPIVLPLVTPDGSEEQGQDTNTGGHTEAKQTMIYGVRVPLIRVGDIVVDFTNIYYMELSGRNNLPTLHLEILDDTHRIRGLQNPGSDNEVRLQILPVFENAYKKIDLTFYIVDRKDDDGMLILDCIYKVPELYNSRIQCFGQVSTYQLFEKIAQETKLGFASNIVDTGDVRYLYCCNTSFNNIMDKAIETSGESGQSIESKVMLDYWVDFWNNLNLVDVWERYTTVEPDENIKVWTGTTEISVETTSEDEQLYTEVPALLSNNPIKLNSELYVDSYDTINNSTQVNKGSDRVFSIYNIKDGEALDYMLSDGDQQNDVFTKIEYLGECYSDFNYLLARECRAMMMDKVEQQIIEVTLQSPMLGLMRGGKVNLHWFDTDAKLLDTKRALNLDDKEITTNIPLPEIENEDKAGPKFQLNKTISGQYYILNNVLRFEKGNWSNTLQLVRPRENVMIPLSLKELYEKIES
jgi:hypothetical protein